MLYQTSPDVASVDMESARMKQVRVMSYCVAHRSSTDPRCCTALHCTRPSAADVFKEKTRSSKTSSAQLQRIFIRLFWIGMKLMRWMFIDHAEKFMQHTLHQGEILHNLQWPNRSKFCRTGLNSFIFYCTTVLDYFLPVSFIPHSLYILNFIPSLKWGRNFSI